MTVLVRLGAVESRRFGFELVKPSSVVVSGGGSESATISALGSVEFSAATGLSLNGVFSSGYDNYMIACWSSCTVDNRAILLRYRTSGSDATGSDYVTQRIDATSTTVAGSRSTAAYGIFAGTDDSERSGVVSYVYGPYLAQPTAFRSVPVSGKDGASIYDFACTHSLSTSYESVTLYPSSGTMSGRVAVYGMRG